jgi:hypothetical protein
MLHDAPPVLEELVGLKRADMTALGGIVVGQE